MRFPRLFSAMTAAAVLVLAACLDLPTSVDSDRDAALEIRGRSATVNVIVVLNSDFAPGGHAANKARAAGIGRSLGADVTLTYGTALFGFAGSVSQGRLLGLSNDPRVAYVEVDQIASIPRPRSNAPKWCTPGSTHPACGGDDGSEDPPPEEQVIPWGVTRVGGAGGAEGKTAWVIDTGIDLDHPDLNVDVARGVNFARGKNSPNDGNGHGTHVAGTIGAIDNNLDVVGVAAGVALVPVRVLDNSGSGYYSWVIAGVDYVAANAAPGDAANMSLGGPPSEALDAAVVKAAGKGVYFSLAAGNSGNDASNYSPARVNHVNVFTVSAIGENDCFASFSNWGNPPVDFAAPGVGVLSTANGGGTTTFSGTSMAAPHVAGLLLSGWSRVMSDGQACSDPDGSPDPIAVR